MRETAPPSPLCRNCGKPLRPNYATEKVAESVRVPGGPWVKIVEGDESTYYDSELRRWGFIELDDEHNPTRWRPLRKSRPIVSRRWLGTYGFDGDGLFCSLRCGYRFAVRQFD